MGRLSSLVSFVRRTIDGIHTTDVEVDPGGGTNVTGLHASAPGDDAYPLPEDTAIIVPSGGSGRVAVVGYVDTKNEPKAAKGDRRIYSRDGDGVAVAEVWLKADGSIVVTNEQGGSIEMAAGGDVTINGVVIDTNGNVRAPGEVTAKANAASVSLSTHTHPDAMGGTGAPTPGT